MQDVKTYLLSLDKKLITPDDIYELFNMILINRNLIKYVNNITFTHSKNNYISSDAAIYNKELKTIEFDIDKYNSKSFAIDGRVFDATIYAKIVALYEVLVGIEKVQIENITESLKYSELKNIKELFQKHYLKKESEKDKYFDLNDNDIKIYESNKYLKLNQNQDMLSLINRYIKLKAIFETIDIIATMYSQCDEIIDFYNNNIDIISSGYFKENGVIRYPIYYYFLKNNEKDGKKYLKEFTWYNEDDYKMLSKVSSKYSFKERVIYGMPVDECEYRLIRKKYEG